MDQKEARAAMGTDHHFKPDKKALSGSPPKYDSYWFNKDLQSRTQPLTMPMRKRQDSVSSDAGTASPVGTPTDMPAQVVFPKFVRQNSKNVYSSFGFSN